jgi:hypothetical protein
MPKLSPTQRITLETLHFHHANLIRKPGGFWTYSGCPVSAAGMPVWWITVGTVRALERMGVLVRVRKHDEEWRDERTINYEA